MFVSPRLTETRRKKRAQAIEVGDRPNVHCDDTLLGCLRLDDKNKTKVACHHLVIVPGLLSSRVPRRRRGRLVESLHLPMQG